MGDLEGAKGASNGARVTADNVIEVVMEDLSERDREEVERELQRELKEEMVEWRKKKLACFQKTRSGVVKKEGTAKASTPVNSPFTLKELVHMIDVSVNSKYGADLEGITRTLTNSMRGSLDSLRAEFRQESERLPRQLRAMVQQVVREAREKREMELPGASTTTLSPDTVGAQSSSGNMVGSGNQASIVNLNLTLLSGSCLWPWSIAHTRCLLSLSACHADHGCSTCGNV
jgi:hypothetical protein